MDVLIDAINHKFNTNSSSSDIGLSRTMVFANTVEAVEAITKVLQEAGIECFCYHSESSLEERTRNLVDFQQKGGVFVCTDAAARGIDIPNVSHVIQVVESFPFTHSFHVICLNGFGSKILISGITVYLIMYRNNAYFKGSDS